MEQGRVLVVDDEPKLVRLVREVLTVAGYTVLSTGRGENAVEMAAMERPDLILLDVVLAGAMDGFGVVQRVREFSDVPVIMLTARDRETDLVHGFEQGADDYITKPFSAKELLVRVRAVIRRSRKEDFAADEVELQCGELRIDLPRRRVTVRGQEVHLTPTEYRLLHELAAHKNQVMLHAQLLAAVWGPEYRDDLEYLRAYVRYLRQKIEADPGNPLLIQTSPGVGYMLACPD
jgi:two-component system, OmpR family, KDP operon response regulator KdpE